MDIWQHAKDALEGDDLDQAHALGFDRCQQCGEWFHLADEGWIDCVTCGRHCPTCVEGVEWEWCDSCGLYSCLPCAGDDFRCPVCLIPDHYA